MSNLVYKPVADGVYEHKGSIISVGGKFNQLSVSEKKRNMRIWVSELPDNWRLCEGKVVDDDAPEVPSDDIIAYMRFLAAAVKLRWLLHEANHPTTDEYIAAEAVEKWLDSLPKKEANDANLQT